jgi:hypothetical protein
VELNLAFHSEIVKFGSLLQNGRNPPYFSKSALLIATIINERLTRDHIGNVPANHSPASCGILIKKSEREAIARCIFGD